MVMKNYVRNVIKLRMLQIPASQRNLLKNDKKLVSYKFKLRLLKSQEYWQIFIQDGKKKMRGLIKSVAN
jgi:hypothetical protein